MSLLRQQPDAFPAFHIGIFPNFGEQRFAADPFPFPPADFLEDEGNGNGFQMNAWLALVVKGSVQATGV